MKLNYNTEQLARIQAFHNPNAKAVIKGSDEFRSIEGKVLFYRLDRGVLVIASIDNLPKNKDGFFAFHLHEGRKCEGDKKDEFADAGMHFNPDRKPHPEHAGDFPPLLSNRGSAYLAFVTDRFEIREIIGRTVIVHMQPDDFETQPSGNAGEKIACGVIKR